MNCYKTAQYLAREIEAAVPSACSIGGGPRERASPALPGPWRRGRTCPSTSTTLPTGPQPGLAGALPMPCRQGAEGTVVQRILVRQGFGLNMARLFLEDFRRTVDYFARHGVGNNLTQQEAGASTTDLASAAGGQEGPCPFRSSETAGRRSGGCRRQPGQPLSPASAGAPARPSMPPLGPGPAGGGSHLRPPGGPQGDRGHGQCHLPSPSTTRKRLRRGTAPPPSRFALAWRGKLWYNERNRAGTWTRPGRRRNTPCACWWQRTSRT